MCGCCVNNRQQLLLYYVQSSITHNKLTPKYVLLRFCKRVQTIHTYVVSRPGYTSLFLPPSLSLSLFLSRSLSLSLSPSLSYTLCVSEDVRTHSIQTYPRWYKLLVACYYLESTEQITHSDEREMSPQDIYVSIICIHTTYYYYIHSQRTVQWQAIV